MPQTTPTIVTDIPELTPEIKEVYSILHAANDLVEKQTEVVFHAHYSSFHIGNNPLSKPETVLKEIVNTAHDNIRSLAENIGGLFQPELAPSPVQEIFDALQMMRKNYKKEPATMKKFYAQAFGPDSAKPLIIAPEDLQKFLDEKRYFKNIDGIAAQIKKKDIGISDNLEFKQAYQQAVSINHAIAEKLELFSHSINQLPHIILGHADEAQIQLNDHVIPYDRDNNTASIAFMFFGLHQMSKHDVDNTVAPGAFAIAGRTYFGQSEYIMPRLSQHLKQAKLYTQPLIVSKFQEQVILLTEDIAHAVGDYKTLITECPPEEHKFELITMLGLHQENAFETAKKNYLLRESAKAEKPKPERKKPVMSCPFGYTAPPA